MSQFDMTIVYICGEDKVADALSCVPIDGFATKQAEATLSKGDMSIDNQVGAVLSIATDVSMLEAIQGGYKDKWSNWSKPEVIPVDVTNH